MIIDTKGNNNKLEAQCGISNAAVDSVNLKSSNIDNGIASGDGLGLDEMLLKKYGEVTIESLLNTYRNPQNIIISSAIIDIDNVNKLNLLNDYRYLNFRLTGDIDLHIDAIFIKFAPVIGSFDTNGFKVYSTDGISKQEINFF